MNESQKKEVIMCLSIAQIILNVLPYVMYKYYDGKKMTYPAINCFDLILNINKNYRFAYMFEKYALLLPTIFVGLFAFLYIYLIELCRMDIAIDQDKNYKKIKVLIAAQFGMFIFNTLECILVCLKNGFIFGYGTGARLIISLIIFCIGMKLINPKLHEETILAYIMNKENKALEIEDYAYSDQEVGVKINIKQGITTIGKFALYKSKNLRVVEMPKSVKLIKTMAFYGSGIDTLYYEGSKEDFEKIVIEDHNDELINANIIFNQYLQN